MVKAFQDFLQSDSRYPPNKALEVLKMVRHYFRFSWSNKKLKYFNVPSAFDIETTSFINERFEKCGIMYAWTFGIYGAVIYGRRWDQFIDVLNTISKTLELSEEKRFIVYSHNLPWEFQFMRKYFKWTKVFAIDSRKPVYAITDQYIEFRCSYMLSGYSLQKLGEQLVTYKVRKAVGDLDYSKPRHSKTPMMETEVVYMVLDVKVVMAYIQEQIESRGGISKIPLTKTGYVREYCRNSCFYDSESTKSKSFKRLRYREVISALTLESEEYKMLQDAFQGGFTHANPFCSDKIIHDVTSYDFTSSYPTVMIADRYPMSKGEKIDIKSEEELNSNLNTYCCLFEIEIEGLKPIVWYENYLSESRCKNVRNAVLNNGRIVSADHLITTITEQDYLIMKQFYKWDHMKIGKFYRYKRDYLPTDFIKAILKLYENKCLLKHVPSKEVEYMLSKGMLNSCYGMIVTNIIRDIYEYATDWMEPREPDLDISIGKYNKNPGRFLFYPWGVWVTAYARRNLFTGICNVTTDYVYSDTDSIKIRNASKHLDYIESYNTVIKQQLIEAMKFHNLPYELVSPDGKWLGVWDFDGHYADFKTLGAKRYLVRYSDDSRNGDDKGKFKMTVAGLSKQNGVKYLLEKYGESEIFDGFKIGMEIPADRTGKLTHTYIDDKREGILKDYLGVYNAYSQESGIHLSAADYKMSISKEYSDYLLSINKEEL